MAKASDKKRWDRLHEAIEKADEALKDFEYSLSYKYGLRYQDTWLSSAQKNKLQKLRDRVRSEESKIIDLLVNVSPRGEQWLHGAPSWWLARKLTWEDALRPANESLSVVVPGAYGYPDGYVKERTMSEYQGWANWETWNVALWFGNDEGLYRNAVREAQSRDGFDADGAEDFVRDLLPDGTPDFRGEPGKYDEVDWQAIADDFNEMAGIEEDEEDEDEEDEEDEDEDEDEFDDEDDVFSDDEMREGYVISDARGGGYNVSHEGRNIGEYDDMDDALEAIESHMKNSNFFPNIYYVNDHGNVDLIDADGNTIESRV